MTCMMLGRMAEKKIGLFQMKINSIGIALLASFLFACTSYRHSTERYFVAVTKSEFKRFSSDKCVFDLSDPIVITGSVSQYNPFQKLVIYQSDRPSQIIHETAHHYLGGASR